MKKLSLSTSFESFFIRHDVKYLNHDKRAIDLKVWLKTYNSKGGCIMIEELLYEEESSTLDFKQEQYPFTNVGDHQKSELLKDILAFANAWRRNDAYILIGVEEVKGGRSNVLGIDNTLDDAALQQFVNSKTQRPLIFEYKNYQVENKTVGVIKIPINERPIHLKKDYGKLKKNVVYLRRGSSTDEATPDEIAKMGASAHEDKNIPSLDFSFANRDSKTLLPTKIVFAATLLKFKGSIPKYEEKFPLGANALFYHRYSIPNQNYYEELFDYYFLKKITVPIAFCIKNTSYIAATDIKIELVVDSFEDTVFFLPEKELKKMPSANNDPIANIKSLPHHMKEMQMQPDIKINRVNNFWQIEVYYSKVQAGQTIFTKDLIYLASKKSIDIKLTYHLYADNLPSPIKDELNINMYIDEENIDLDTLMEIRRESITKLATTKNSNE